MKMEGLQNQPFILQFITSAWEEKFSRGDGYAGDPDGGDRQIPKRSCSAGRGCFEIQRPRGCPAGLSDAASDGRGLCGGYRGAAAFDFQAVMGDFEKNIAILRKKFL